MNRKILSLALGLNALLAASESKNYLPFNNSNRKIQPDYLRKKCKSCKYYHPSWGVCGQPNEQACVNYAKKKK